MQGVSVCLKPKDWKGRGLGMSIVFNMKVPLPICPQKEARACREKEGFCFHLNCRLFPRHIEGKKEISVTTVSAFILHVANESSNN